MQSPHWLKHTRAQFSLKPFYHKCSGAGYWYVWSSGRKLDYKPKLLILGYRFLVGWQFLPLFFLPHVLCQGHWGRFKWRKRPSFVQRPWSKRVKVVKKILDLISTIENIIDLVIPWYLSYSAVVALLLVVNWRSIVFFIGVLIMWAFLK